MERTDYEQQEVSVWNKNIEPPLLIQMFYDFIIDEENRIRKRNHEKKFQKRDLYKEISENINLSEDIVKRCQGIKIEGRPEKFLLGCVEAGMKHRVSAERIKEFVEVCTDSCWTYYKYKVEIENHMENKNRLEYYRQKDNENSTKSPLFSSLHTSINGLTLSDPIYGLIVAKSSSKPAILLLPT